MLLSTVMPAVTAYDPLSPASKQMQQTTGLAGSVAGMFFGNSVGLAAGGTALVSNLRAALFPNTEFRSAIAQASDGGALAFCTKEKAPAARTRLAYLWAYRIPDLKRPDIGITGGTYVPLGSKSTLHLKTVAVELKELARAREWRLIPVAGGEASSVPVTLGGAPDSLLLDLSKFRLPAGDYQLSATWDWDPLNLGTVHLRPYSDFSHVQVAAVSKGQLLEGKGLVSVKLTGADFEFVDKVDLQKVTPKLTKPTEVNFELLGGRSHGEQQTMTVEIDTTAAGAYRLLLAQSDGVNHTVPVEVLPANPVISNLPMHVNLGEESQALRIKGKGLERVESFSSDAGPMTGIAEHGGWSGQIKLNSTAKSGQRYALVLKVQGVDAPVTVPDAILVVGQRPRILSRLKSLPQDLNIELREDELPAGIDVGLVMATGQLYDSSSPASGRPRLELGCRSGESRQSLTLAPDEHIGTGATLSFAGPDSLYLSLDPGTVGYPGCELAARVAVELQGTSDWFALGRVLRIPRLDHFTLTSETLGPEYLSGCSERPRSGCDREGGLG